MSKSDKIWLFLPLQPHFSAFQCLAKLVKIEMFADLNECLPSRPDLSLLDYHVWVAILAQSSKLQPKPDDWWVESRFADHLARAMRLRTLLSAWLPIRVLAASSGYCVHLQYNTVRLQHQSECSLTSRIQPMSLHQLPWLPSKDNKNISFHKIVAGILVCVPCPRSIFAHATLISN